MPRAKRHNKATSTHWKPYQVTLFLEGGNTVEERVSIRGNANDAVLAAKRQYADRVRSLVMRSTGIAQPVVEVAQVPRTALAPHGARKAGKSTALHEMVDRFVTEGLGMEVTEQQVDLATSFLDEAEIVRHPADLPEPVEVATPAERPAPAYGPDDAVQIFWVAAREKTRTSEARAEGPKHVMQYPSHTNLSWCGVKSQFRHNQKIQPFSEVTCPRCLAAVAKNQPKAWRS